MTSPAVILVRPREEGNIGAAARAMANMGLERLVLVEPAPRLGGIARGFGVGGWEILERAERAATFDEAVAPFSRLVGTASRRQRPLHRHRVITARQLPEVLVGDPPGAETALIFGPEDNGLSRRELEVCHPVVTVPCAPDQPTLNLAQAVLLIAYELFAARQTSGSSPAEESPTGDARAKAGELHALHGQVAELLRDIGYDQEPIRAGLLRDLRQVLARAEPSAREVRILRRLCNRTLSARATRRAATR